MFLTIAVRATFLYFVHDYKVMSSIVNLEIVAGE